MMKIEEFYNEDTLKLFTSPYDPNIYKFKNLGIRGAVQIPLNYETPISEIVYDQGQTSMCSACSSSKIRLYQESDDSQSGLNEKLSAGKIYADREDKDYKGEGMYIVETAAEWKNFGSCLESDFPYYDSIFSSLEQLLEKWNDGTILFLMAFLAKSLFETKFSEDNKLKKSNIESKVNDVVQSLDGSNDSSVG